MGKKSIFDDENVSEYDQMNPADVAEPSDEVMDEILDTYDEPEQESDDEEPAKVVKKSKSTAYQMNSTESDIMSNAMIQLEQAKLYDMFLKHNLFQGVKANPAALKRVEKELKDFILERLQILLGMKTEKKVQQVQQVRVELPFNNIEIDFLKALSLKGTQGASANAKPAKALGLSSIRQIEEDEDEIEQPQSLKSIGQQHQASEEEEEEYEEPVRRQPVKRQPAPAPAPIKKKARITVTDEEVAIERKRLAKSGGPRLSDDEIRAAKEDIKRMSRRNKPAHLMDPEELKAEAKRLGSNKPKVSGGLPMPSADQQLTHYMTQQMRNQSGNPENNVLMNLLSKKMGFSTTGVHQDNGTGDE